MTSLCYVLIFPCLTKYQEKSFDVRKGALEYMKVGIMGHSVSRQISKCHGSEHDTPKKRVIAIG